MLALWPVRVGAQTTCTSVVIGTGNWNLGTNWDCGQVPGAADTVIIDAGDTIILDLDRSVATLTVNGTLSLSTGVARSFTVSGDVTIGTGGTLNVQAGAAATSHTVIFGGSVANAGTLDFVDGNQTAAARFIGGANATITGSGTTSFAALTIDKGTSRDNTLDVQAVITLSEGGLAISNGTFRLSSASNITPFSGGNTIPDTGGFYLNNAGATVSWGSSGSLELDGALTVASGTLTVGANSGNKLEIKGSTAALALSGGVLNVTGRVKHTSNSTTTITGGTLNVATAGQAGTTSEATFDVPSASSFTMTGGTVHLYNGSGSTGGALAITTGQANVDVSGGTIILGNGASTSGTIDVEVNGSVAGLDVDAGTTTATVVAGSALDVQGGLTITSGSLVLEDATASLTTSNPSGLGAAVTSRVVDGDAGWRMLAPPVDAMAISDITDDTPIQGYGDGAEKNFYTGYDGTSWTAPGGLGGNLTTGSGFILYFFDNNQAGSSPLPVTLDATGSQPSDPVVSLHAAGDTFNLIGDPFGHDVDVGMLVGVGAAAPKVGQVWQDAAGDPAPGETNTGSFVTTSAAGDALARWQGAFVENSTGATAVVFPNAAKTGTDATFRKAGGEGAALRPVIGLALSGHDASTGLNTLDEAAVLVFTPDATAGWDGWDASKLTPLTSTFATLAFKGRRDGTAVLKAQESRPIDPVLPLELPLVVTTSNVSGALTITWPIVQAVPDAWQLTLVDHERDREVDLRHQTSYAFEQTSQSEMSRHPAEVVFATLKAVQGRPVTLPAGADARFTLRLTSAATTTRRQHENVTAGAARLLPNYPNPFDSRTIITYVIATPARVRLAVVDVLGREVAVLVDRRQAAGRHHARWDAGTCAAGTYAYRLQVDGQVLVGLMSLAR